MGSDGGGHVCGKWIDSPLDVLDAESEGKDKPRQGI